MSLLGVSESEYYHPHAKELISVDFAWEWKGREGHKTISCCLVKKYFQAAMPVASHPSDYSERLSFKFPFIPSAQLES